MSTDGVAWLGYDKAEGQKKPRPKRFVVLAEALATSTPGYGKPMKKVAGGKRRLP